MQDDDRMRSKEAVQMLERFVTSVGDDTTANALRLKHFQSFRTTIMNLMNYTVTLAGLPAP